MSKNYLQHFQDRMIKEGVDRQQIRAVIDWVVSELRKVSPEPPQHWLNRPLSTERAISPMCWKGR